jgi:hypothetical protein
MSHLAHFLVVLTTAQLDAPGRFKMAITKQYFREEEKV